MQFGFRDGKSTCDALSLVKQVIKTERDAGGCTIAVSIDIKNAFNFIPWNRIRMALLEKRFPKYLVNIIGDYLSCRAIEYPVADGGWGSRPVRAGVPQGSVLGPLLWNIAFDSVLNCGTEPGLIVCYADDTLVLASADTVNGAVVRANLQVGLVLRRVRHLGLKIAADKTEVVLFHDKGRGIRKEDLPYVQVDTEWIKAGTTMKYLGVILDGKLKFMEHFKYAAQKATKITKALCRLMPNLRGPTEAKRRLYAEVVLSVILYGAPIWSEELPRASRDALRDLDRVMRVMAIRVIAGYRTVSLDAAGVLGRIPPLRLLAGARKRMYERVRDLKEADNWSKELDAAVRKEETLLMRKQWELYLQRPNVAGKYTRDALLPSIHQWLSRGHKGGMTFRLSQLLTGHGSFAVYLFRIGKVDDSRCAHCNMGEEDSALHTLARCEA